MLKKQRKHWEPNKKSREEDPRENAMTSFTDKTVTAGAYYPLGATVREDGVNFAIYSLHAAAVFPLFKVLNRKTIEVHTGLWVLAGLSLLFYIFYPY